MSWKDYEQTFRPSEKEIKMHALAVRYHSEAEAYDRSVCTGGFFHGSAMPANSREMAMVGAYAHKLRRQIMREAEAAGIDGREMTIAIGRAA